ncbi:MULTISPECIES: fimbria/pilus periplasmic chaperone [Aeromonas]|uniref:EcpB family pilus assembly chaperone n=1 Tax=Aeromonas TaxID=642 RepID=UPI000DD76DE0|nr:MULTISPECIES: fimbria/pilus periplasmic chaperone [Aeromonas]AXB00700.1 fimbria/pilus periplasmic chaperone [Aeromonas caviae]QLL78914.1 fimbria/pilus periplasmic chaperone [Aeromonas caviae]QXB99997.1 fimbria/pilus periplasmic chaperone [Aeromonas sp. FDAARGOS 1418]UBS65532.1 fimbria/pilus periplasmic chaperone [Aeromonas caviae]WKS84999.1 fimbria/pilus periplasmic chaperone [Aeromonas caviae]
MNLKIIAIWLLLIPGISQAINVGAVTTFIDAGSQEVAKQIENGSDQARLVTISVTRITSPEEGGQEIPMEVSGELMLSPSRLMLPANARNNVRFFYKGPQDDKERYYRIRWLDTALSVDDQRNERRQAVATTSAQIGTILVVTPRQHRFAYDLKDDTLTNQGNASYRTVAYGPCLKGEELCKETYYDLPGKQRRFKQVNMRDPKSHLGLWLGQEFVVVK